MKKWEAQGSESQYESAATLHGRTGAGADTGATRIRTCSPVGIPPDPSPFRRTTRDRAIVSSRGAGVVGGLVVLALVGTGAWRLHKSRSYQLMGELVTSVATEELLAALTFDDGPSPHYTPVILELLAREQVRATFFVVGSTVERHPELARRILEEGHELGNHSYSHRPMVLMSQRRIRAEVERTDSLIHAAGAAGPILFRPPYGKRLIGLPWYLSRTGRPTILWSLEPDTWHADAEDMVRHVLEGVRPGSIILLHVEMAARHQERAALAELLPRLRERGYRFVTVSELMAAAGD
jgi:peptidoglycan-N-acetylglucosamine deacetylase